MLQDTTTTYDFYRTTTMRAVRAKNWVDTSNFDKSMKIGTNALHLKSFRYFEGDMPKSHAIADASTFFYRNRKSQKAYVLYIKCKEILC